MATVMTISALPVAARVLHDLNLLKADIGFITMAALAVNDIIGWVLFTIVLGLFTQTTIQVGSIIIIFAGTVGFAALALSVASRAYVLETGRVVLEGPAQEVLQNPEVQAAYLGGD